MSKPLKLNIRSDMAKALGIIPDEMLSPNTINNIINGNTNTKSSPNINISSSSNPNNYISNYESKSESNENKNINTSNVRTPITNTPSKNNQTPNRKPTLPKLSSSSKHMRNDSIISTSTCDNFNISNTPIIRNKIKLSPNSNKRVILTPILDHAQSVPIKRVGFISPQQINGTSPPKLSIRTKEERYSSQSINDEPLDISHKFAHHAPFSRLPPKQPNIKPKNESTNNVSSNLNSIELTSAAYIKAEESVVLEVDGARRSNQNNEDIYDYCLLIDEKFYINTDFTSGKIVELQSIGVSTDTSNGYSAKKFILDRILKAGLEALEEDTHVPNQKLIKIYGDSERLEIEAEKMRLPCKLGRGGWAVFSRQYRFAFLGTSDPHTLFHSSERQMIIQQILHAPLSVKGAGLDDGILNQAIIGEFPVHMKIRQNNLSNKWINFWRRGTTDAELQSETNEKRDSSCCSCYDGCFGDIYSFLSSLFDQPLDAIADYFGEEIAFYYAWLGFYTRWLVLPAILGFILFIAQVSSSGFDGPLVPIFCVFMACWSTLFIEMWQRESKILAHRWGVSNYETHQEKQRIGFKGDRIVDPVSGAITWQYPAWKRWLKYCISIPSLSIFGLMCLYLMILIFADWASDISGATQSGIFEGYNINSPLVYGFMIPILDIIYIYIAYRFNEWENYQTDSLFYKSLTVKVFTFRFTNCFLSLFYYAFYISDMGLLGAQLFAFMISGQVFNLLIKIVWPWLVRVFKLWSTNNLIDQQSRERSAEIEKKYQANAPKTEVEVAPITNPVPLSSDDVVGKMKELVQLGGTYSLELLGIDYVTVASKRSNYQNRVNISEACVQSVMPTYTTFEDYTEMMIQFGYVTFFSVAFPLAPLCALVNNIIAIRSNAYKLCHSSQRPIARKASSIGIWLDILQIMSLGSLLTNCAVIFFTSTQLDYYFPSISETQKVLIIFLFEHVMLLAKYLIHISIPSLPRDLQEKIDLEKFEAERAKLNEKQPNRRYTMKRNNSVTF